MNQIRIGQLLRNQGVIDETQLLCALAFQRKWGGRLGEALLRLRMVREDQLLAALSEQAGVPFVAIGSLEVPPEVLRLVPEKLIRRRHVFPVALLDRLQPRHLLLATSRPSDLSVLDEVAFAARMRVKAALASDADIAQAIDRHFDAHPADGARQGGEPAGLASAHPGRAHVQAATRPW